jgi:dipeptide transport system permease protein
MTAEVRTSAIERPRDAPPHPLVEVWWSFCENKGAVAGLVVVLTVFALAILADIVAPYSPTDQFRDAFLKPPAWADGGSARFLLGTDDVGRDILSRLIHGSRYSLFIGALTVALSLTAGVVLGLIAGFARGLVEEAIMRLMDIMLALPSLLLALVIVAILGPSLTNAIMAIAIVYLPHFTRVARASVITELSKEYVTASRVSGAGTLRLMFVTVLPNCAAPLIVLATLNFSDAILAAAALGFLGLGAQPPTPSWGNMIDAGRGFMGRAPLMVIAPAAAILFAVLSTNLLGEGLQLRADRKQSRGMT